MTYATLLVHLQSDQSNESLLTAAGQFADRFGAHVIGIAACQPLVVVGGTGTVCGSVFADNQRQVVDDLVAVQAEFRAALKGRGTGLEWRSDVTVAAPASYLCAHARSADLIMTGSVPADALDLSRTVSSGSLVMEAGRPVFIVPADAHPMAFDRALIGWRDTRECRRAVADALPLLKQVARVAVLEIAAVDDLEAAAARVQDVVTWLKRHAVAADGRVARSNGNDVEQLHRAADEDLADFIVAGAYGHSRLREWMIGGMTRDLLLECSQGVLVSH